MKLQQCHLYQRFYSVSCSSPFNTNLNLYPQFTQTTENSWAVAAKLRRSILLNTAKLVCISSAMSYRCLCLQRGHFVETKGGMAHLQLHQIACHIQPLYASPPGESCAKCH